MRPIVALDDNKNPISCITKGFITIIIVIQKSIRTPFETSLPNSIDTKYILLIVHARTIELPSPEKKANSHMMNIFITQSVFTFPFLKMVSTKDASNVTLYPDAEIIWESPDF